MRYASTIPAKPRKSAARHDREQEEIGEGEARDPRERGVGLRDRRERLRGREPHLRRHAPAEEVRAGEGAEGEGEHEEPDPEGPPVLARLHDRHPPLVAWWCG